MIDAVLPFLPLIDEPQPRLNGWIEQTPSQSAFIQHLYDANWLVGAAAEFSWGNWDAEDRARTMNRWIAESSPETLRRLLTAVIRADRFHDGGTPMFDKGWMIGILRRLSELRDATPTEAEYSGRQAQLDSIFAEAAAIAASHLKRFSKKDYILEDQLEQILLAALDPLLPEGLCPEPLQPHDITTWKPTLRALDLVVRQANRDLAAAVELKIENVDETLQDAYKLTAEVGYRIPAYMVVIASKSQWAKPPLCHEFFDEGVRSHDTREVFERNRAAWIKLITRGNKSARPFTVPSEIETRRVAALTLRREPQLELRIAGLRISSEPRDTIDFEGDWPAPEL